MAIPVERAPVCEVSGVGGWFSRRVWAWVGLREGVVEWRGSQGWRSSSPGRSALPGAPFALAAQLLLLSHPRTLTKSRDDEVSGAGSSPVLGGVNLLSSNFSFPELFTQKVEEQWQRPEGPPRPTAATRTADHHQQAWGSEKEVRPGPHTQLRGNKLALKTGRADKAEDEVLTRSGEAWAKCRAEAVKCEVHRPLIYSRSKTSDLQ
uniref:Uncharacterized protein n=1 Tax=Bos mutus grunniens TaxID=30521 RepID=A0A8B9YGS4_BOSMU